MSLAERYLACPWQFGAKSSASPGARLRLSAWPRLAVPVALYAATLVLLLWRIGDHPDFAYNWESYTVRDVLAFRVAPSLDIFRPTDGLMTNSGTSPLMVLPIWLAFKLGGANLVALRLPVALIAGLAAPLLWALGRRLAGDGAATLATCFLILTPAYLLYARTATLVGLSVAPALLTVLCLCWLLRRPRDLPALVGLQALLILNTYAYAPIRILWPLSLALLGWELLRRRGERRWLLRAVLVTAVVLPACILIADHGRHQPLKALKLYYNAGGEQIQTIGGKADGYGDYLVDQSVRGPDGHFTAPPAELARRLVLQNAGFFANLLLDRGTKVAIVDFWTAEGRLYTRILVPFFFLGFARSLWRAWWHLEDRLLIACLLGFGVPIIFTSRVHIGRLDYFLPFLLLLAASGFVCAATWLGRGVAALIGRVRGTGHDLSPYRRALVAALAVALLIKVGQAGWEDYRVPPLPSWERVETGILRDAAPEAAARGGGVVIILAEGTDRAVEGLVVGQYELALADQYRFVDLTPGDPAPPAGSGRTAFYYGNPLISLDRLVASPGGCAHLYYVDRRLADRFAAAAANYATTCDGGLAGRILPER